MFINILEKYDELSEDCKQSSQKFWLQEIWIVTYSVFWNL